MCKQRKKLIGFRNMFYCGLVEMLFLCVDAPNCLLVRYVNGATDGELLEENVRIFKEKR